MNIILPLFGFIIGFISFLGIIVFCIFFFINKYKNTQLNKYKKPLIISTSLFAISILIVIGSFTIFKGYPNEDPGTITKAQFKEIKEGMTKKQIKDKLGDPITEDKEVDEWDYKGIDGVSNDSEIMIFFEENEVSSIIDDGLTKIIKTDDSGDADNEEKTNFDYEISTEVDIEDAVGKTVDWNGDSQNVIRDVTVNDNAGKNDGSKVILLKLNAPIKATNSMVQTQVNKDSLKIIKNILEDPNFDAEVNSITFFWYLPLTDKYGNDKEDIAYKINLEKRTLDKMNLDNLNSIQLDSIADQYKVLFN